MSCNNPAALLALYPEPIQELPSHPSGMLNAKLLTFVVHCINMTRTAVQFAHVRTVSCALQCHAVIIAAL